MARFLVDESLPRSTATGLQREGHLAEYVRDIGLAGRSRDFANTFHYRPSISVGTIVLRLPTTWHVLRRRAELLRALVQIGADDLLGRRLIIDVGQVRLRRFTGPRTTPTGTVDRQAGDEEKGEAPRDDERL